jgi:N-methylhydantoinase A/oxoprolinase/acetone carboxylase beta subunit
MAFAIPSKSGAKSATTLTIFSWKRRRASAPRHLRLEVPERLDVQGEVLLPLDEAALIAATRQLVEVEKVEALAIGFLHAWRGPAP